MMKTWPAPQRNRDPIRAFLAAHLPAFAPNARVVLEIGAGTGQHAVHLAAHFPQITWLPTDPDPTNRASISAWRKEAQLDNLLPPVPLDTTEHPWPASPEGDAFDLIVSCNMIHIAPWEACLGLMAGAGRHLAPGGLLYLYGPFNIGGVFHAPSNARFDQSLRGRDPRWGVRDLNVVKSEAANNGLAHRVTEEMPANNLSVLFQKLSP